MPDGIKLSEFVAWCQQHITGDEKGQAQIFLDRLFQAFGQPGSLDVGGKPEFRIRKSATQPTWKSALRGAVPGCAPTESEPKNNFYSVGFL